MDTEEKTLITQIRVTAIREEPGKFGAWVKKLIPWMKENGVMAEDLAKRLGEAEVADREGSAAIKFEQVATMATKRTAETFEMIDKLGLDENVTTAMKVAAMEGTNPDLMPRTCELLEMLQQLRMMEGLQAEAREVYDVQVKLADAPADEGDTFSVLDPTFDDGQGD